MSGRDPALESRGRRRLAFAALVGVMILGLGAGAWLLAGDEAEREYMAYLRGDEDGSTDAQRQAHIDRAISLAPDRARYHEVRATDRFAHHDLRGALEDLDRAIALEDRPYLRHLRGLTLCHLGEHARALDDFDRAVAAQPTNTQFLRGRGLARIEVGRAADALADGDQMVRDAPQWGESYYVRAMAERALGRDADALADLDEALRRRPELVYAMEARAACRERMGDAAGAAADRARAASERMHAYASTVDPYAY